MWIFTETGFVSAVRKDDAPNKITARARDRRSLQELSELSGAEIITTEHSDYRYRVVVSDDVFKSWFVTAVDMLDYDNFKNRIWETRGDEFHDALGRVWSVMYALQRGAR
jgi:hypothetical protein